MDRISGKVVMPLYCTFYMLSTLSIVYAEYCPEYGHSCVDYQRCCGETCCIPTNMENHYHTHLRWSVWNMWYFWFVVLFVLMSCFGGCSYYRRHQLLMARQQSMMGTTDNTYNGWRFPPAFPVSLFTGYDSHGQQRATPDQSSNSASHNLGTAFPTPPPYAEVMSEPELYPPSDINKDLPPYPGPQYPGAAVPPYINPVPQLPPYSGPTQESRPQLGSHGNREATSQCASLTPGDRGVAMSNPQATRVVPSGMNSVLLSGGQATDVDNSPNMNMQTSSSL